MKKYIVIFLIVFMIQPLYGQVESEFNIFVGGGGGDISEAVLGIQAGGYIENYNTSISIDTNVSIFNTIKEFDGMGGGVQLGGLVEYFFAYMFLIGAGGGIGWVTISVKSDDESENSKSHLFSYPYIRGSFSIRFFNGYDRGGFKVGLYYDYCFDIGNKVGIRFHYVFG